MEKTVLGLEAVHSHPAIADWLNRCSLTQNQLMHILLLMPDAQESSAELQSDNSQLLDDMVSLLLNCDKLMHLNNPFPNKFTENKLWRLPACS